MDRNQEHHDDETEGTATDSVCAGKFVDTFRYFHPTRTNAFTCWSTRTGARQTNYGTRIDYIFADCRLAEEYFVAADIMPEVEGSDHCPVWGQLSCPLVPSSKPPPLCTRYLPEFAGRQQKLSRFFVKVDQIPVWSQQKDDLPGSQDDAERRENLNPLQSENVKKRTLLQDSDAPKGKKTKMKSDAKSSLKPQGSLLSFFKPKLTNVLPPTEASVRSHIILENSQTASPTRENVSFADRSAEATEVDCGSTSQAEEPKHSHPQATVGATEAKKGESLVFWKSVFRGPPLAPSCKVHGEPCVLRTVKKEGPNVGKQFFVCARPQGHASNPEARCNFFEWVDKGK